MRKLQHTSNFSLKIWIKEKTPRRSTHILHVPLTQTTSSLCLMLSLTSLSKTTSKTVDCSKLLNTIWTVSCFFYVICFISAHRVPTLCGFGQEYPKGNMTWICIHFVTCHCSLFTMFSSCRSKVETNLCPLGSLPFFILWWTVFAKLLCLELLTVFMGLLRKTKTFVLSVFVCNMNKLNYKNVYWVQY